MRALMHLVAVALAAAVGTAVLAANAWSAAAGLASVPVAWWSTAQIAQSAIALACGLGAAGCLWHLASAGLALTVLLQDALTAAGAPSAPVGAAAGGRADTALQRWGAPLVRRITAGAVVAGLAVTPVAAAAPSVPDDLGWRAGAGGPSAPQAEPAQPAPGVENGDPDVEPPAPGEAAGDRAGALSGSSSAHVVGPGESLWSITAAALGPGAADEQIVRAWPLIYETNAERIGADPSLIHPGDALDLPDSLTRAQGPADDGSRP